MTDGQMQEFFERLEGPMGCDFKEDGSWRCKGGNDKSLARAVLAGMGIDGKEADEFLEQCHEYGGYCDCEIIFNAWGRFDLDYDDDTDFQDRVLGYG